MRRKKFRTALKKLEEQIKNLRFQLLMLIAIIIGAVIMSISFMNQEKYFIDSDFGASYLFNAKEIVAKNYTPIGFFIKSENKNGDQITTISEEPESSRIAKLGASQKLIYIKKNDGTSVTYRKYIKKSEYMKNIFCRFFIYFSCKLLITYFVFLLFVAVFIETSKYLLKKTLEEKKKKMKMKIIS